jgi:hypothetical protein
MSIGRVVRLIERAHRGLASSWEDPWCLGLQLTKVPLLCDNESAIRMADNPVEHSRTKHIAIRYHFLRDHQQNGDIEIAYINTKDQ